VRIDQADAVTGSEMLHDAIAEQWRFFRTRFADEEEMLATIGKRKTKCLLAAPDSCVPMYQN
jgi:hypothetical protein